MGRLDGKVVFVSGGARGLGRAMAEEFLEEGARVVVGDVLVEEARSAADSMGGDAERSSLTSRERMAGRRRCGRPSMRSVASTCW